MTAALDVDYALLPRISQDDPDGSSEGMHKTTRLSFGRRGRLPLVETHMYDKFCFDDWVQACGRGEASLEVVTEAGKVGVWE